MPFAIANEIELYRQLQRQGTPTPYAFVGAYPSTRNGRFMRLVVLIESATSGVFDPWPDETGPSGGAA
jgi:hypothetical protein